MKIKIILKTNALERLVFAWSSKTEFLMRDNAGSVYIQSNYVLASVDSIQMIKLSHLFGI